MDKFFKILRLPIVLIMSIPLIVMIIFVLIFQSIFDPKIAAQGWHECFNSKTIRNWIWPN